MGVKIPVEVAEGLLINVLNQAKEMQQTTLMMMDSREREHNHAMVEIIKASNERLSQEIRLANERMVTELRNLLYPQTGVELQRSYTTEESEDAQFAFEQGWIDKETLDEVLASIEPTHDLD